ncbi:MAG: DNA polymerase III subunit beta [Clostridiales bacterium]|jgi:DNA polymerase-3 subunit beta|nr:DNA polymerase III subunit beta [Eubacteriales bacterium]MDH7567059.1 DNA polymerase III subunit beta [Clostridiales bacterium]
MRVICSKENLMEGINIVQKAVSSKSALPILEGILIEADGELKLTGNDLEIGIECFVEADIKETGSIVINSKMFGDIVRRLPEAEVLIEVKDNHVVVIECENSHFEIKGLSSEGYPEVPSIAKENTFSISQRIVRDMIRQTLFAVSIDENRPILTGSLVECREGKLTFVSIDGFRLALRQYETESKDIEFSVVIPGKTLNEVLKILQPLDTSLSIYSSNNQIMFDMGRCRVVSRLLEGEYLNYRSIIPKEYETKVRVNTREMLSSIERASLITVEEKKYPIKISISDDKLVVTSNTDIGNVREELRIEMDGKKMDIGFNPRYFIEALRVIEDETIEIFFTSSIGPCTLRPVEKDAFAYMILPVRIKND